MTKARDYKPEARQELIREIIGGIKAVHDVADEPEPDVQFSAGHVCLRYYDLRGRRRVMFGDSLEHLCDRVAALA